MKTSYQQSEHDAIVDAFLFKFSADPRPLKTKLTEIGMPKGTYSRIINNQKSGKHCLETMRAWVEGRKPRHKQLGPGKGYCRRCETITAIDNMKDEWTCLPCRAEMDRDYYKRNYQKLFKTRMAWRKRNYDYYRQYCRRAYLKKHYGKFAECVSLIQKLKEELVHVQK